MQGLFLCAEEQAMHIRTETSADQMSIFAVIQAAFRSDEEAKLVDQLREEARHFVSLAAENDGDIVGHIAFSEMRMPEGWSGLAMGLAPLAVHPMQQRKGVGAMLVQAGLEHCRQIGAAAIFVLGATDYYGRFGFRPASSYQITLVGVGSDDHFQALELTPDALGSVRGEVRYHPAFDRFF